MQRILYLYYTLLVRPKPKGVLHTTAGYIVYASITHKYVFNYINGDIYWCTADVGWVQVIHIVYGPRKRGYNSYV